MITFKYKEVENVYIPIFHWISIMLNISAKS